MSAALRGTAVQQRAGSARTAAVAPVQAAVVQTRKLKAKDAPKPPPPPPRKAAGGTVKVGGCWRPGEAIALQKPGHYSAGNLGLVPARLAHCIAPSLPDLLLCPVAHCSSLPRPPSRCRLAAPR